VIKRKTSTPLKFICLTGLLLFFYLQGSPQNIQDKIISGNFRNVSLDRFFKTIEDEYHIHFYYKTEWIQSITINQNFKEIPLIQALNLILGQKSLMFKVFQNNSVVVYPRQDSNKNSGTGEAEVIVIGNPLNQGRYHSAKIKGKILDGKNNEPLVGAVIFEPQTGIGATSNSTGNYEIELPTGDFSLRISYMGYQILTQKVQLIENGKTDFELFEETHNIDEVTVTGENTKASKAQMSMVKINSRIIKELPVMMGEADIIKSIIMLPGIQTAGEMAAGFNVRGGNADQNLVLMEGAPVFNTSHLFGFFSMINPDAVQDLTLFKGGIPASYGERVSSIMDIKLKEGNTDNLKLYGGLGIISSRLTLEGPFAKKKKSTFVIGGRTTYSDWILKQTKNVQIMNSIARFFDINATANIVFGTNNTLKLMGYVSQDRFNLNSNSLYTYGNILGSATWKVNISKKLLSNLNLSYSKYDFQVRQKDESISEDDYKLLTGLQYGSAKYILSWLPNEKHRVNTGFQAVGNKIAPGEIRPSGSPTNVVNVKMPKEQSIELAAFIDDDIDLSPSIAMNLGMRYARFMNMGPVTVINYEPNQTISTSSAIDSTTYGSWKVAKMYQGIEPRLSLKFSINNNNSLRFSYQRMHQFINQVSNTSVISPADFWKLSDAHIKPLISDQLALGLFRNSGNGMYETSVEFYYKKLQNLMEYKNGAILVMNRHVETGIINAQGYAYGLELFLKKNTGRLNGWISYTYSRTMRKTDNTFDEDVINSRKYYPSVYDKPHDLSTVMNYQISRRWRFSGNFVYSSGRPVTLPELKYTYDNREVVYYSDRNKYRMPPYHRLDLSITFDENLRKKRMWKGSWTFSVYNVYGRKNAYSIYYRKESSVQTTDKQLNAIYKLSVIGVPVPSITYNFKF
jgi:hypothetical protein